MTTVKTIFVFNTGSSSVKISLLAPNPTEHTGPIPPPLPLLDLSPSSTIRTTNQPIRILTAHAERIGTVHSTIHISISSNLIQYLLCNEDEDKEDGSDIIICPKGSLNRKDSLEYTSRMSSSTGTDEQEHKVLPVKMVYRNKEKIDKTGHKDDHHNQENKSPPQIIKIQITNKPNMTHEDAIRTIMDEIQNYNGNILSTVSAVGHRVVHGGSLSDAVVVDDHVMDVIRENAHLAPLHNPNNLLGIQISKEIFKNIPQIAVFDTAFHTTMPEYAYTYAIPKEYRDMKIRKYGFHGTSVKYVSKIALEKLKALGRIASNDGDGSSCMSRNRSRLIVAHLGNGASITAVVDGKSVDTTMEFTPLTGLMMGTRSGSIDPAIVTFASSQLNKAHDDIITDLNKRSGLLSISNGDSDMRSIEKRASEGDKDAILALDMFVYTLAKQTASMMVACGGMIDALVFTAGIGENSALVRKKTMALLQNYIMGTCSSLSGQEESILDETLNEYNGETSNGVISRMNNAANDKEQPIIMVVHTDEECGIYDECVRRCITNS